MLISTPPPLEIRTCLFPPPPPGNKHFLISTPPHCSLKNLAIDKLVDKSFEVSTEKGTVYKINSEMTQCSCSFMATFMLPCKHIFACRDMFNFPLFAPEMVDKRWEKGHFQDNQFRMPNKNRLKLVKNSQTKLTQKPSQMTSAEKFCKASLLTKQLADLISQEGQNVFEDKMKDLEKLLSFWQKNIPYEIIEKKNCPPFDQASLKPSNTKPNIDPPSSIVTSLPLSPKVENNSTIPTNINVDTPSMKDSNPIPDISLDFSKASTFPNSDVSLDTQELKSKLVLKTVTQRRGRPKGSKKPYNVFSSKKDNPKPSGTKTNLNKKDMSNDDDDDFVDSGKTSSDKNTSRPTRKRKFETEIQTDTTSGKQSKTKTVIIEDSKVSPSKKRHIDNNWIPKLNLNKTDLNILRNKGWLNSNHIDAIQKLIKARYPKTKGLQSCLLVQNLQYTVQRENMVQILHCGEHKHWLTYPQLAATEMKLTYLTV